MSACYTAFKLNMNMNYKKKRKNGLFIWCFPSFVCVAADTALPFMVTVDNTECEVVCGYFLVVNSYPPTTHHSAVDSSEQSQ